jgi:NADPH oxidase 1
MRTFGSIDKWPILWHSGRWSIPLHIMSTSSTSSAPVSLSSSTRIVHSKVFSEVRKQTAIEIHYHQPGGITGHFMLLIMFLMYSTAHHKIRNQCFEAFWYTHHLAFFFMIGLYTHATGCFVRDSVNPDYISTFPFYSTQHCLGYESWRYTIWPGILYFGERVYREIRARRVTRLSKVLVHPSGAMELRIIKPSFKYTAGQWLFIQVPEISRWQWHPVSTSTHHPLGLFTS